ncbi:hypothetical protein [Streptomyces sp. NBC_01276]|uniref:hypothetical protein n=1 Tax=Streptomyces sp. NBC_01276 TaxID=2903808 RepID=UPI00352D3781
MGKNLDPQDITVVRPAGTLVPPHDNSNHEGDDNDSNDSGGHDGWFGDDTD